jgi:hypothetical protein
MALTEREQRLLCEIETALMVDCPRLARKYRRWDHARRHRGAAIRPLGVAAAGLILVLGLHTNGDLGIALQVAGRLAGALTLASCLPLVIFSSAARAAARAQTRLADRHHQRPI